VDNPASPLWWVFFFHHFFIGVCWHGWWLGLGRPSYTTRSADAPSIDINAVQMPKWHHQLRTGDPAVPQRSALAKASKWRRRLSRRKS
jgi:hypothetical protein